MAKAQKLPSGNYRVRVTDPETGERKSFTAPSKRKAELAAPEWQNGKRTKSTRRKTVGEAVKEYIESKENLLSPSSVRRVAAGGSRNRSQDSLIFWHLKTIPRTKINIS